MNRLTQRKASAIAALLVLASGLSGCGKGKAPAAGRERVILASFLPMYVMTENVARGVPGVRVENMAGAQTGCLHDYQLTPADMRRIEDAWIFVANGGGMESFLGDVVRRAPGVHVVDASRGIELLRDSLSEGGRNPHVWVSVEGAVAQVRSIEEQLARIDAANAARYRANGEAYVARLDSLRRLMHRELDPFRGRRIVTFHEAFPYFAREFGLEIAGVVEREPGSEPGAAELARTVEIVRESGAVAVFAEPQYPAKAAEAVARETGIPVRTLDPAASGESDPDSYLRAMGRNLRVLREALGTPGKR